MLGIHRHYTSTLAANAAILLLGVVSGVLAARLLGPQGRGELAIITLWPMALASLGSFGISQAVVFHAAQQPQRRSSLFTGSLVIAVVQSLVLVGAGYLLLPYFFAQDRTHVLDLARLFLLFVPLSFFSTYLLNLLNGAMCMAHYNFSRVFQAAWYAAILVALFLLRQASLDAIVSWQLAGYAATGLLNAYLVRKLLHVRWEWETSILRPVLSYGAKTHLGSLTYYLNQRLDQLVMSLWLPPEALGQYVVAVALAAPLTILPGAIGIVTLPAAAREKPAGAEAVIRRSLRTVVVLLVAGAALLFVLVPYLLPLLFGQAFVLAVPACRVLVIAMVPLGLSQVLYESLRGLNHPLAPAYAEGLGNVVTVALLALLLPRFGFLGAALASLGAYTASFLAVSYYAQTRAGLSVVQLLRGTAPDLSPRP
ncbi:MAG: oligosaccharide flippase family protein [Candidatus Acidiferrales bacterium]